MTADKNKSIYVTYNHLNLPYLVQKTTGDNILYYNDATGRKLSQQVTGSSFNVVKKTDYAGSYFYENDTLKFINHAGPPELQRRREEGRVIMTGPTKEYQYNLTDHLGNVRTTFTTKDKTITTTATLEASNMIVEKSQYLRYDDAKKVYSTLLDHTNGALPGYSQRLNGSSNEKFGLAKSLSVMPGDVIRLEVYAKYIDTNSGNWNATLTTLMSQLAAASAGVVIDGIEYANSSASFPTGFGTLTTKDDNGAPRAYLNWLIFDRNYQFVTGGFKQISTAAKETGTDVGFELVTPTQGDIVITDAGYVYAYLSNESSSVVEVYFDDFKVTQIKSPVIQTDDYYPFGLAFNEYQRESSLVNNYQYNGKEKQDELNIGWSDYGARMYMSDIGRWGIIDPLAELTRRISPYVYAYNNPLRYLDPDGMYAIQDLAGNSHEIGNNDVEDGHLDADDGAENNENQEQEKPKNTKVDIEKKTQEDQNSDELRSPLLLKEASLEDILELLRYAQTQKGNSQITVDKLVDVTGIEIKGSQIGNRSARSFDNGRIEVEVVNSKTSSVDTVSPYYPGVNNIAVGKSWNTDPTSVPTGYPNPFRDRTDEIAYPYQLVVYGTGKGNNERVIIVKFSNLNDFMAWYRILKKIVLSLIVSLSFIGCGDKTESQKFNSVYLEGLWYFFEQDSTYYEIYYTDSSYMAFMPDNYVYYNYKLEEGDTLLVNFAGELNKFKLSDIEPNSFMSTKDHLSILHHRLVDTVFSKKDWARILKGPDDEIYYKFRSYYLSRESDKRMKR